MGLTNLYEADDDFRLFCAQIDALAFLPFDDVTEGIKHLRNSAPDEAASLLDYLDASYVTGQLRPRAHGVPADGLRLNFRRIAPIFSTRQWNMHDVTLENQPRTMTQRGRTTNSKLLMDIIILQCGNVLSAYRMCVLGFVASCCKTSVVSYPKREQKSVCGTSDQTLPFV